MVQFIFLAIMASCGFLSAQAQPEFLDAEQQTLKARFEKMGEELSQTAMPLQVGGPALAQVLWGPQTIGFSCIGSEATLDQNETLLQERLALLHVYLRADRSVRLQFQLEEPDIAVSTLEQDNYRRNRRGTALDLAKQSIWATDVELDRMRRVVGANSEHLRLVFGSSDGGTEGSQEITILQNSMGNRRILVRQFALLANRPIAEFRCTELLPDSAWLKIADSFRSSSPRSAHTLPTQLTSTQYALGAMNKAVLYQAGLESAILVDFDHGDGDSPNILRFSLNGSHAGTATGRFRGRDLTAPLEFRLVDQQYQLSTPANFSPALAMKVDLDSALLEKLKVDPMRLFLVTATTLIWQSEDESKDAEISALFKGIEKLLDDAKAIQKDSDSVIYSSVRKKFAKQMQEAREALLTIFVQLEREPDLRTRAYALARRYNQLLVDARWTIAWSERDRSYFALIDDLLVYATERVTFPRNDDLTPAEAKVELVRFGISDPKLLREASALEKVFQIEAIKLMVYERVYWTDDRIKIAKLVDSWATLNLLTGAIRQGAYFSTLKIIAEAKTEPQRMAMQSLINKNYRYDSCYRVATKIYTDEQYQIFKRMVDKSWNEDILNVATLVNSMEAFEAVSLLLDNGNSSTATYKAAIAE